MPNNQVYDVGDPTTRYGNKYPALGFQMAMIELECFSVGNEKDGSLLIVPRIAKRTEIMERTVVEVSVGRGGRS